MAANNAVRVGKYFGEVIGVDLLVKGLGVNPDQLHAIGHSLGGHLVGHFGRIVKMIGGHGPISRITCKYFLAGEGGISLVILLFLSYTFSV